MPLNVEKVKSNEGADALRPGNSAALHAPVVPGIAAVGGAGLGGRLEVGTPDLEFAAWVLGPAARIPPRSDRPGLQAVLFDLDGVLVDTAEFHYRAWQRLADELTIPFDRTRNHAFRGVGRMECLEKLLGVHGKFFAAEEKHLLADRKNAYYLDLIRTLSSRHLAPGVTRLLAGLNAAEGGGNGGIRTAVVSASRNARLVLDRLGIADRFDVLIDGNDVTRGKPDPQGFLLAADRLRVRPERCVVVEDAESGARAAQAAGMAVVGIGDAVTSAAVVVDRIEELTVEMLESLCTASEMSPNPGTPSQP
jgi:beta-phosphoglucomutase